MYAKYWMVLEERAEKGNNTDADEQEENMKKNEDVTLSIFQLWAHNLHMVPQNNLLFIFASGKGCWVS